MAEAAYADDKVKQADSLFAEGQALLQKGRVPEACAKMEESYALDAAQGTLLNMAFCHEKQGRVGLAFREYRRAAARAEQEGDASRLKFAASRATELEAKLVRLEWEPDQRPLIISVSIDGDPLLGEVDRVFVEPGKHVLDVTSKRGKAEQVVQAQGPAGQSQRVHVALPEDTAVQAPTKTPPILREPPRDAPPIEHAHTKRTAGWITIAAGGAVLAAGGVFGALTFSAKSSAVDQCPADLCTPQGMSHANRAHAFALVSTIAVGVGVVAIGVGSYLVLSPNGAAVSTSF